MPLIRSAALLVLLAGALAPRAARAQLRPLDPLDWRALDGGASASAQLGASAFWRQRASIGGVQGRLLEAPFAFLAWTPGTTPERAGRIALRAVIHPLRILRIDSAFAPPLPGTDDLPPGRIVNAGDNALETAVRLTPDAALARGNALALRYGVRLSTHNDKLGLDRHKTDFYATLAGRAGAGRWVLAGEAGLGVYGTRPPAPDKALPFLYSASARTRLGRYEPSLALTGQTMRSPPRGNENLSELRAALRAGRTRWLEATAVAGLTRFSPRAGALITFGAALP